jgi:hypothetical protein
MVKQKGIVLPKEKDSIPLASLEILSRMYPLSPEKVIALIEKAFKGEITLRNVQREYSSLTKEKIIEKLIKGPPDLGGLGAITEGQIAFRQRATEAVFEHINLLSGEGYENILVGHTFRGLI